MALVKKSSLLVPIVLFVVSLVLIVFGAILTVSIFFTLIGIPLLLIGIVLLIASIISFVKRTVGNVLYLINPKNWFSGPDGPQDKHKREENIIELKKKDGVYKA